MHPQHEPFDPAQVLLGGLRAAGLPHRVCLGVDATYRGEPTTIIQVVSWSPMGALPRPRLAFRVQVSLSTVGPDWDDAFRAHMLATGALLSLTDVGEVRISSVTCDAEPVRLSPHTPSGGEMVASTYSMIMRGIK